MDWRNTPTFSLVRIPKKVQDRLGQQAEQCQDPLPNICDGAFFENS